MAPRGWYLGGDATGFWGWIGKSLVRHRSATERVDELREWAGNPSLPIPVPSLLPVAEFDLHSDVIGVVEGDQIILERWGSVVSATRSTVIVRVPNMYEARRR
jgi:hypothetical protein